MKMTVDDGFAFPKPTKKVKTRDTGNKYKDRSISQEDRVAARLTSETKLPFQRVLMSGANKEHPGDVRSSAKIRVPTHKWLLELKSIEKTTTRGEFVLSIKLEWLLQIIREAVEEHSLPALVYEYPTKDDEESQEFIVLRLRDFEQLLREHVELTAFADAACVDGQSTS